MYCHFGRLGACSTQREVQSGPVRSGETGSSPQAARGMVEDLGVGVGAFHAVGSGGVRQNHLLHESGQGCLHQVGSQAL